MRKKWLRSEDVNRIGLWEIYITTCKVNDKIYVGRHRITLSNYKNYYIGSGVYFLRARKELGYWNFYKEILCYCGGLRTAKLIESYFIIKFESYKPEIGYNLIIEDKDVWAFEKVSQRFKNKPKDKEQRDKIAKATAENWKDEGFRTAQIEAMIAGMSSEEVRTKMANDAKKQWEENREKMVVSLNTKECKDKMSNRLKVQYEDGRRKKIFQGDKYSTDWRNRNV